jgi:hypothetical protein
LHELRSALRVELARQRKSAMMMARYKKLFRSSPAAAILAVYGLIDLVLLLTAAEVERVKALLHALGVR